MPHYYHSCFCKSGETVTSYLFWENNTGEYQYIDAHSRATNLMSPVICCESGVVFTRSGVTWNKEVLINAIDADIALMSGDRPFIVASDSEGLHLIRRYTNGMSQTKLLTEYIAIEVMGSFWFWPEWTQTPHGQDIERQP